ncbi:hypothetical protein [Sphingopyxis sp. QXT-31]|uniref:hypothetical protein n=1 Tax=Sphingopyxis sp. QXT-31 TaxID=1357916 RepID=UPI0018DE9911|nr:hypothetical protein [Sphingopyxis sp. QXT-31]
MASAGKIGGARHGAPTEKFRDMLEKLERAKGLEPSTPTLATGSAAYDRLSYSILRFDYPSKSSSN